MEIEKLQALVIDALEDVKAADIGPFRHQQSDEPFRTDRHCIG